MLAIPYDFLGNSFKDWLLQGLSRDQGEADWPGVPWILLALLQDRSNTSFSYSLQVLFAVAMIDGSLSRDKL